MVPALSAEQVLYRHYDTVWTQQGLAGVGGYWQQGQDAGAIVQVDTDNGSMEQAS